MAVLTSITDSLRSLTQENVLHSLPTVILTLLTVWTTSKVLKFFRGLKAVSYIPGTRPLFHPLWLPGALIPSTWWNPGLKFPWNKRHTFYRSFESEVVSLVPILSGFPTLYTSNLDVARQVAAGGHKTSFIKPKIASQVLLLWGMNVIAADGEVWRKHRRVMGPAFTNKTYEYVWEQSISMYKEMVAAEGWRNKKSIDIPVLQKLTFKFALFVIARCGFGFPFTWNKPPTAPDGSMSVQEALEVLANAYLLLTAVPKWVFKLPFEKLRKADEAFKKLSEFMQAQVVERKKEVKASLENGEKLAKDDAFTRLVEANESEGSKYSLDDDELIGNVFVLLFAGHETTAHSLAATLGFLAYYADIQQEVYSEILTVVGPDGDPAWVDYGKLEKVIAVFFEAVRMFPAGYVLIREAIEDTVITIPNPHSQEGTTSIPVPKGTQVVVDMIGVQYNPRYFDEPEKFKPSRWYGIPSDSEAFSAFSIGARMCLGRKFAMTEAVAFLTMLLRDWKVEPLLEGGETREQWKNRVMDANLRVTLGVSDMPVRFLRR